MISIGTLFFFNYLLLCFIYLKIILFIFIFGCAESLLLCGLFSSCSEWGLLLVTVSGLLIVVASLVVEHGFLGTRPSVVVASEI